MENTVYINKQPASSSYKERFSGIELLKILAVVLIIISHVVQTLGTWRGSLLGYSDYYINLRTPSLDAIRMILTTLKYAGSLGNYIFLVCSFWFLCDKNIPNIKKALRMFIDIFVISIIWLVAMLISYGPNVINQNDIIRSLLPTSHSNNWFMSMYLVFVLISPLINIIINKIDQKIHLLIASASFILIFVVGHFHHFVLANNFTAWLICYFVVSYLKRYGQSFNNNIWINVIILISSILLSIGSILIMNSIGLKDSSLDIDLLKLNNNYNCFDLLIGISLFNLFNKIKFKNKFINYISGLSLYIYLIHENILFRTYVRPYIWQLIYVNFGYTYLLGWVAIYVVTLFIGSLLVATIYKESLRRLVHFISDLIYKGLSKIYNLFNFKHDSKRINN